MPPAMARRVIACPPSFFGGVDYPALRVEFFEFGELVSDCLAVVVRLVAVDQADDRVFDRVAAQFVHTVIEFLGAFAELSGLGEMLRERRIVWQAFRPHVRVQAGRQRVQRARPDFKSERDERARAAHTTETS